MRIIKLTLSLGVLAAAAGGLGAAVWSIAQKPNRLPPPRPVEQQTDSAADATPAGSFHGSVPADSSTSADAHGSVTPQRPVEPMIEVRSGEPRSLQESRPPRLSVPLGPGPPRAPELAVPGRGDRPLGAAQLHQQITRADALLQNGKVADAHRALSDVYWRVRQSLREQDMLLKRIAPLSQRIFFSAEHWLERAYVVQPNDTLERIGKKYKVAWEYLARVNGISDPRRIRVGQRLKVIKGPFEALVDLSDFEMVVLLDGRFVRRYDVGIGKQGTTPIGSFFVREKLKNPTYYGPDGVVAADDPENPLGERWIDIGGSYGIHGTIEPDSIGQMRSEGCIRMYAEDVAEVYDLLVPDSRVRIQP